MRGPTLPFSALLLACGSSARDDPEGAPSELRIDMRPVHAIAWSGVLEPGDVVRGTEHVTFAWADEYPSTLDIAIERAWATCGSLSGTFAIDSIVAQHDALVVTQTEASAFRIAPSGPGLYTALVRGTFVAAPDSDACVGAEAPFELTVEVDVRRPVAVTIDRPFACRNSDRVLVESDALLDPSVGVRLVDADGEPFSPRNAASTHPATLTLQADADTALALDTPDDGLAALVVSGAPGPVLLYAFDAEAHVIDHVAPADIVPVGVRFSLLGNAGNPTPLDSGEVYGENGWARTTASIGIASSGLEADGQSLCTLPREGAFALTSATPQTCIAYDELGHGVGPLGENVFDPPLPISAEVIASGVCTLHVDAPDYADGHGFTAQLSVEIRNAESLAHAGEGR